MSQQGHAQFVSQPFASLLAEDVVLVLRQFSRGEPSHVLHQAQDGDSHLFIPVHVHALARIGQGHLLGRGDYHRPRDGEGLEQRQVDVARARRGVDDEVVQVAPVGIAHQLLQCVAGHAPAPQRGLVGVDKEADGEQLQSILLDGDDEVAAVLALGIRAGILHLEHLGHGRSEDVGIQQPHLVAQLDEGHGQVGGHGALAHAALAPAATSCQVRDGRPGGFR